LAGVGIPDNRWQEQHCQGGRVGMQSQDYAYWQARLGEQGRYQGGPYGPQGMYPGPEPGFGGGWVGPDREYFRSIWSPRGPLSLQEYRGGPYSSGGPYAGRGPRNYQRGDERIHDDVCEALTRHGDVDACDIEVEVQNGEVTLRGTVPDRRQKRMAEDMAESVPGVRDVHNQLRLSQTGHGHEGPMQPQAQPQMTRASNGGAPAGANRR
jgi:hypothetical protein